MIGIVYSKYPVGVASADTLVCQLGVQGCNSPYLHGGGGQVLKN